MAPLSDILGGYRPVGGETLRIDGTAGGGEERFAAADPRRLHVEAAPGTSARLVVWHSTPVVSALTFALDEGARLEVIEIFTAEAFSEVGVRQAARSRCRLTTVVLTSANCRYTFDLDGRDAESAMGGVFLLGGEEHAVVELRTNHNAADCRSDSFIKGIAGGCAVGEFCGLVYVAQDAQHTDARQQSRNILLSDTARILTRPQLEIYADDVKCSHGATVGLMDAEAILYMRQRGLSLAQARRLQIEGFVGDIVRQGGDEVLSEALMDEVARKMEKL